jgi:hypothetical protein
MKTKIEFKVHDDCTGGAQEGECTRSPFRIGTLQSSDLVLQGTGIARMHAVLQTGDDGQWELIDLGSAEGTWLNNARVEMLPAKTKLPEMGSISIGAKSILYKIVEDTRTPQDHVDEVSRLAHDLKMKRWTRDGERAATAWPKEHHQTLAQSLLAELGRIAPSTAKAASSLVATWAIHDRDKKLRLLRMLVSSIRETRQNEQDFHRRRYATTLQIGVEGIEAIYALTPEVALERAHETVISMAAARQALSLMAEMKLSDLIEQSAKTSGESPSTYATREGYQALQERLENTVAGGTTLLLAYLSRGGGHTLTDNERTQMRNAFDEVQRLSAANAPK